MSRSRIERFTSSSIASLALIAACKGKGSQGSAPSGSSSSAAASTSATATTSATQATAASTDEPDTPAYVKDTPEHVICASSCDLSSSGAITKAFNEATSQHVALEAGCSLATRGYPQVAAFGTMDAKGTASKDCTRRGVFVNCCFTDDARSMSRNALQTQGWREADLPKRILMAENWVQIGIWGLSGWKVLLNSRDFFEAKLILKRQLEKHVALPTPDGGVKLTAWMFHESLIKDSTDHKFEYIRWEYVFDGSGALQSEKRIDQATGTSSL
jgi:hypothetical protein